MKGFPQIVLWLFGCLLLVQASQSTQAENANNSGVGAVVSAHSLATDAGIEILEKDGNAFDAAVAVTAALAVVEPYSSGLGGGGFWLLHRASDGRQAMLDGREKAPRAANRDMYLNGEGTFVRELSLNGPLAAGIPGVPAGLVHLAGNYGRLPLDQSLAPAIRLAREGFLVSAHFRRMAEFRLNALRASPVSAELFLRNGSAPSIGTLIVQSDLADTLESIARQGRAGFYSGTVAGKLVDGVQAAGGIWTLDDLQDYRVAVREPVAGEYRGVRIVSAAPPSSGGIVLLQALNILESLDLAGLSAGDRKHLIIEAMRRAYRDRAEYLGDPDFVSIPVSRLTNKNYARDLASVIELSRATPSNELPPVGSGSDGAGTDTTHFSIVDRKGNRVAATLSINYPFGSAFTVSGSGVLLNNEMDDFSSKPQTPNVYGLVGDEANAIAGGKRPLSSMSPTFIEEGDRVAVLGTPGGSRIISMVLLAILDFAEGNPPSSWVSLPRYHHQYLPDEVQYERGGLTADEVASLQQKGHVLRELNRSYGNMQAILFDGKGMLEAASDPRGEGLARVTAGGKRISVEY